MSFDIDALRSFVCETLGEPWRDPVEAVAESDINQRKGDYLLGQMWDDALTDTGTCRIIYADVQKGHLVYVHRHWRRGGASRLIHCGKLLDLNHLRTFQLEQKVYDSCVWLDWSYESGDTERACARYGWRCTLGDDARDFGVSHTAQGKTHPYRLYTKKARLFCGQGNTGGRTGVFERFSFAKSHYQEMLYLYLIRGRGPRWEIPQDIPGDYVDQVTATKCFETQDADGVTRRLFRESETSEGPLHRHDYGDAELGNLVAADLAGMFGE